jgi:hypothetical protein
MTPQNLNGVEIKTVCIDEYVRTDLAYLDMLHGNEGNTLLALVGVQSHQFQRSLDLAAYALANGVRHCVIGGPHPMTCDTSTLHGSGVSFALAEAEMIWLEILSDAISGELKPVYGADRRWQRELVTPVLEKPSKVDLNRYVVPMIGIYPARGCPYTCSFCSVIKIAGHRVRSQTIDTTISSLRHAKAAGVKLVMFTSDNFNKYVEAPELLTRMIEERMELPFFVQCDTQVAKQEDFIELLGRAGCFQMFVGVESFSRKTLLAAHKAQNYPELYGEIVRLCRQHRIITHFSNILGFPDDTEASIQEHVDALRAMQPDCASFYILTPIPGTQQYDDFKAAGWITERNMDRFDATCTTWRHPHIPAEQLSRLLFKSYQRFYSVRQILVTGVETLRPKRISPGLIPGLGVPIFMRVSAAMGLHPMSGGVGHIYRDHVSDYAALRRNRFGYDLLPLPESLELSPSDAEFNKMGRAR